MRTLLLLVLAATSAAAQGTTPVTAPLAAHLLRPGTGEVTIDVSEKAYVAIFSVPGDGRTPTLLYPGYPNPSPENPGEHLIYFQAPVGDAASREAAASGHGPYTTTIVLIASRTPLDLDTYGRHRTTLVRALGGYSLASSTDADTMIDRIVHLIAPKGTSVTLDTYTWLY